MRTSMSRRTIQYSEVFCLIPQFESKYKFDLKRREKRQRQFNPIPKAQNDSFNCRRIYHLKITTVRISLVIYFYRTWCSLEFYLLNIMLAGISFQCSLNKNDKNSKKTAWIKNFTSSNPGMKFQNNRGV